MQTGVRPPERRRDAINHNALFGIEITLRLVFRVATIASRRELGFYKSCNAHILNQDSEFRFDSNQRRFCSRLFFNELYRELSFGVTLSISFKKKTLIIFVGLSK